MKIVDFQQELNETFDSLFLNCEETELDAFISEKYQILENLDEIHQKINPKMSALKSANDSNLNGIVSL